MREFMDSKNRVVIAKNDADATRQFSSLSAENAWRIKVDRGGMIRDGVDGLGTYIAPDGKSYRAASLENARAMRDGRTVARTSTSMDAASHFAHREKIFRGSAA